MFMNFFQIKNIKYKDLWYLHCMFYGFVRKARFFKRGGALALAAVTFQFSWCTCTPYYLNKNQYFIYLYFILIILLLLIPMNKNLSLCFFKDNYFTHNTYCALKYLNDSHTFPFNHITNIKCTNYYFFYYLHN